MNTDPMSKEPSPEEEIGAELEHDLIEVGAVSETQGGVVGDAADPFGAGRWRA